MRIHPCPPERVAGCSPSFARRVWPIALLGTAGVLALLLQPPPPDLLDRVPALAAWPPFAQRALLLVNPLVLVLAAAMLGAALAQRAGLGSVLAGTAPTAAWPHTAARAAGLGFLMGLGLAAADSFMAPLLGQAWQETMATAPRGGAALAMGVLYGGLAEEVLMRWGLMSLVAWGMVGLLGRDRHELAIRVAILAAAGLFAAAHLPAVAALADLTPAIVTRTLALNGVAGVLYGWLFWRRHLEAAMAAHAATHLGMAAWRILEG